ncbi:MAG: hypothetical protein HOM52_13485 [Rhodospirillaceae bacterium]|jgi:hypothetical protein|nr:hypothetical protein [Rhodospirillaceae bacterium]MBT3627693.1 hypothetical protein [Rhodospirillaceae bacterium]MBT3928231.1 hypothetical protein [Rhodospirillaceae bacterium]MBT4425297.1 hypothetical protein [Rhodospirillaceae bacterium]MBT5039514.1 hypothetical protein [Rhodospirillaceae bacterium]
MKVDLYTKAILTVIAVCLAVLVSQGFEFTAEAQISGSGQDVRVTNFATDITPGETLHVFCTNC